MPRSSARPPALPEVIDGKFRLVEPISSGTDTVCFLAEHTGIQRQVEFKTLGRGVPFPSAASDRLFREARAMACVSHPAIQSVVDSGTDGEGRPYVVYEALRGRTIAQLLAEHPHGLPAPYAARIVLSTVDALRALHRAGVIARSLGPDDVVLLPSRDDEEGEDGEQPIKLRALERAAFLAEDPPADEIPYTPWLAPEVRRGDGALDPRADVFAIGMMLRHLLTGHTRHDGELEGAARRAIEHATAGDPDERFPDLDHFADTVALIAPIEPAAMHRHEMPTPEDALAADLNYLSRRREHHVTTVTPATGEATVHLLPVLLTIEAIYRRLGSDHWGSLTEAVPGVDDLLPGAGRTEVHLTRGVPIRLFARILSTFDALAGRGDLALLAELGETVAHRGARRLLPDLPEPATADTFVDGFPYVWSCITRQGTPSILERDAGSARLAVRDQRAPSLELSGFVAGLLRACIRNTGVRHSEVLLSACQALGDNFDVYGVKWES